MYTRSLMRSFSAFAVGGLVLLGAGCSREPAPAAPAAGTGAEAVVPSAEGTRGGAAMVARGACDHPYYPLRPGYEVRYRSEFTAIGGVSSGGYVLKVTEATATTAKLVATFDSSTPDQPPIVSEQLIECANGGLMARSYIDMGSRVAGGSAANQFRVVTRNSSGDMLPADVRVGSEWRNGFDIRMEATTPGPDSPLREPIDLTVSITRRAVAAERVRVPAGEYDALKILATTDLGMGSSIRGTEWWVEGVGMVKSTYDLGSGSETAITEATSVTVPR